MGNCTSNYYVYFSPHPLHLLTYNNLQSYELKYLHLCEPYEILLYPLNCRLKHTLLLLLIQITAIRNDCSPKYEIMQSNSETMELTEIKFNL